MKFKDFCYFLLLSTFIFLSACKDDDDITPTPEPPKFLSSVIISNEGTFTGGVGTLTYFDSTLNEITQEVYQNANTGATLGNIVQSVTVHNAKLYAVVNNAHKVVICDPKTFIHGAEIEGFESPRYIVADGSKAFVSQWGLDGITGSVNVLNLNNNTITNTIEVGQGPERMLINDGKLYVTHAGGFGRDSMLYVIDVNTESVIKKIDVGDNAGSLQIDANDNLWVLPSGYSDWMDATNNTNGRLVKITNDEVAQSITLENSIEDLVISPDGKLLYFSMLGKVYTHSIDDPVFESTIFVDQSFYHLGVDPNTGNLLGADPKDFASDGEIFIFDTDGAEVNRIDAGIIPGDFEFVD